MVEQLRAAFMNVMPKVIVALSAVNMVCHLAIYLVTPLAASSLRH